MADERSTFKVLTLLLAVCEQALLEFEGWESRLPTGLTDSVGTTRDAVYAVLMSDIFPRHSSDT